MGGGTSGVDVQFRQSGQVVARPSGGEDQADGLRAEPPGGERQHLRRRVVEPLLVVDKADERLVLSDVGQQAQHRQPDQEPVGRLSAAHPERRAQRFPLRAPAVWSLTDP